MQAAVITTVILIKCVLFKTMRVRIIEVHFLFEGSYSFWSLLFYYYYLSESAFNPYFIATI